jgi:peptidylprolyl isomerase
MPRRTVRLLAVLGLLAALAACGDDKAADPGSSDSPSAATSIGPAPDSITVTGDFGKAPTVKWDSEVKVDDLAKTVLVTGDGDTVDTGSNVLAHIWIASGAAQADDSGAIPAAYTDFDAKPNVLALGTQTLPALANGLAGEAVGSRVLIASPPEDAWGDQGNSQLGVGNTDTAVFVVDLVGAVPNGPDGAERKPAAWAPAIVETDGNPSSLDFTGTPDPSGKLLRTTLIEGTGEKVAKGSHVYVNYLGQVPGSDKPFDESYSRGAPFDFVVGEGGVIKGWDEGLQGVKVGSRVILQVPPDKGYGDAGQPTVGISGTDTMYFVVDVLAVT